tara:strand:- start:367 stop:597 length:231 start_codon:yes stop_codon:yes gene_type:complete
MAFIDIKYAIRQGKTYNKIIYLFTNSIFLLSLKYLYIDNTKIITRQTITDRYEALDDNSDILKSPTIEIDKINKCR